MATKGSTWKVLGNEPIEKLEDNLWHVEGALPDMPLRRRMLVIKLADGSLLVHNAICLPEAQQRELDAWGPVKWIVVPNGWHRLDAAAYADRYPDAKVVCPAASQARVAKAVRVDGTLERLPADPALEVQTLQGGKVGEAVFLVKSGPRLSAVFCDTVFNQPHFKGLFGTIYRALGQSGKPKVTFVARTFMVKDRRALQAHLGRIAALPGLHRVFPGHGTVAIGETEAPEMLGRVAASLR
jgi:hypothetical protein